ncbi:MAG: FHA domain-containing protein [Gammaproteobacteria bacterium]|nr:FHA domain-containing protein [Gammaproteobacteria bacterium]
MHGSLGVSTSAFRSLPDPALLYLSDQHARALAFIDLSLRYPGCMSVLIAERGCGKTILVSTALAAAVRPVEVVQLDAAGLTARDILQQVQAQLISSEPGDSVLPGLTAVRATLARRGDLVVLVIDNAHRIDVALFETINAMTRGDDGAGRLSLVLIGEPGLDVLVHTLDRSLLENWTTLVAHVHPLNLQDVQQYVMQRLRADGSENPGELVADEVFPLLHSLSEGIPARINAICEVATRLAHESGARMIAVEHVHAAAIQLGVGVADGTELALVHNTAVPSLSIARDDETLRVHPLDQERTMIGRGRDNEITIDAPYVSRHHALIVRDERGFWLFDMNSTNGTLVNGQRVLQRQYLYPGDQIRIGRHQMTFFGPRQERATGAAELRDDRSHAQTMVDTHTGDAQSALEQIELRLQHNPDLIELKFERGCLLSDLGRAEDAIEQFRAITESDESTAEAHNNLAVLFANSGELHQARAELEQALVIDPDYNRARENLGNVLLHLALEQFDLAMLQPVDPQSCQIKRLTLSRLLGS